MNLRGLVSVSGKPGLYKLIGQNKSGFILETLDGVKTKSIVNMNTSKMATLEDITVFGESEDLRLSDILAKMVGTEVPDPKSADGNALRKYFTEVAPEHDSERVYTSDIKKILSWFLIIKELPIFNEEAPEPIAEGSSTHPEQVLKKAETVKKEKTKATKAPAKTATRVSQKSK